MVEEKLLPWCCGMASQQHVISETLQQTLQDYRVATRHVTSKAIP